MSEKEYYLEKQLFKARDRLREYERFGSEKYLTQRLASIELFTRIYRDAVLLMAAFVLMLFAYKMIDPTTQLISSIAERNFAEAREAYVQADAKVSNEDVSQTATPTLSVQEEAEQVTTEEIVYIEVERSWFYKLAFNWVLPGILVLGSAFAVVLGILFLYQRFGSVFGSSSGTAFSVVSAGTSTAGMVFAAIRYKSELLEHEVGSYLFLSSLFALVFFVLLLSTSNKILSGAIYVVCAAFVVLVSKFTTGSFGTPISEYQTFLSSLAIPNQTIVVLGTILPVILVILASVQGTSRTEHNG